MTQPAYERAGRRVGALKHKPQSPFTTVLWTMTLSPESFPYPSPLRVAVSCPRIQAPAVSSMRYAQRSPRTQQIEGISPEAVKGPGG